MKLSFHRFIILLALIASCVTLAFAQGTTITLLHANDTHSHLDGTLGGIAKAATVSISIRVFSAFDSAIVKNYAAALYDYSGVRIDSVVGADTNSISFPNVVITGVTAPSGAPTGYHLEQNYPNPFNPSSRIAFTVPRAGQVTFRTYTILGQEDASLEMMLEPGNYQVEYEPGGAAGVVFYQLMTKEFSDTRKMVQFGGEKSGRSRLTMISSALPSRSQQSSAVAEWQAGDFTVKFYNLPLTYPQIKDTAIHIVGLVRDTTVNFYAEQTKGLPCPGTPIVSYLSGQYNTVLVGHQCWLKENLNIGTMISGNVEQIDNGAIEKYCYHDSITYCDTYGGLYQWSEAMKYSFVPGSQGICPPGWHLPTLEEFMSLDTAVTSDNRSLKAVGQGSDLGVGNNISGFSALLTGYRNYSGTFDNFRLQTYLWSSSEQNELYKRSLSIYENNNYFYMAYTQLDGGFSVRCLKDEP